MPTFFPPTDAPNLRKEKSAEEFGMHACMHVVCMQCMRVHCSMQYLAGLVHVYTRRQIVCTIVTRARASDRDPTIGTEDAAVRGDLFNRGTADSEMGRRAGRGERRQGAGRAGGPAVARDSAEWPAVRAGWACREMGRRRAIRRGNPRDRARRGRPWCPAGRRIGWARPR